MSQSSGSSGSSVDIGFEDWLQLKNEVWWNYRVKGTSTMRTTAQRQAIYAKYDAGGAPPIPNPDAPRFFENWHWRRSRYLFGQDTGDALNAPPNENENPNTRNAMIRARYREINTYFGQPRYLVQKVLGVGGNGIATHFRDHGPDNVDNLGRDFVVKVALEGWQSDEIVEEKRMMKKVKGSAHCVQIIEPQDIGKPEEEPVILPLHELDSSTDGDSSGNESLSRAEVLGRHQIPKRRERSARYWQRKNKRRIARAKQIEVVIERQEESGIRKDYIIMEYLQHGSLANLIVKLNEHEREDGFPYRIPNRVLWGFWLCLIRACIAMEYPPRKFHPLRKRPQPTSQDAVDFVRAKANKMIRACKALGIRILRPGEREQLEDEERRLEDQYQQLKGDLIEDLPEQPGGPDQWKLERRQNMVHRDFDPTNIFVSGLELDGPAVLDWQETRRTKWKTVNSTNPSNQNGMKSKRKEFEYTGIRPDRVTHEHDLVPRLKLGDFGIAVCIKREKTNEYYHAYREGGKHGDYPPEYFGPEWEQIEENRYGDQLADSRTCGYYSNKMNIWSSALTMWELITKLLPPTPPAPQPPYDEVDSYPAFNNQGQTDMDLIFNDPRFADFKISYCALLRDPRVTDYNWVDEKLRETIFKCMYHKPDDRPSLHELLSEAERNVELDISGESDEEVRRWIQYWFFDAPSGGQPHAPPGGQPPAPPGGQPPVPPRGQLPAPLGRQPLAPPRLIPASPIPSGADPALTAMMRQRVNRLNADFPNGYDRIFNTAADNLCGLFALNDSLTYQLGLHPTINGVTHHINGLPTLDELLDMHADLLASGALDIVVGGAPDLAAMNNFNVDILCILLNTWAGQVNIELELVCKVQGKNELTFLGSPFDNPKFIYIYNDNAEERYKLLGVRTINHYEGLKPKPAPPPSDHGSDLPDYESDE
ncbi:hypothetical protein F4782DRAFT_544575 [Xylaria castorea]|nr:hypothetical protein F4782DRAFT_544575 [Xylaria castorea]